MVGVVTTRSLVSQWPVIVHEFGLRCLVRCVWRSATARRPVTFLECIDFS